MTPYPPLTARQLPQSRRLALAALLLMAVVVVASAWLRLAQPRSACLDWPGCREALRPALGMAQAGAMGDPAVLTVVRGVHRLAASSLLLLVAAMAWTALRRRPRDAVTATRAPTMLALALGLAALGIVTPGARSAAVLLGNLLGGLLLLALAWSTWRELRDLPRPARALAQGALGVAALWLLQAAMGALSGAGSGAGPGQAATLVHLGLAVPAAALAAAIGWIATRQGCVGEGRALLAVAAVQVLLGAASAALDAVPSIVLVHNATAAAGLSLLFGLALARRR